MTRISFVSFSKFFSIFGGVLLLWSPAAKAAPQILGLLASAEPTKMTCTESTCVAEFTSFCLQQHRKTPDAGTAYVPSKLTVLTAYVTGSDGKVRSTSVADKVSVKSTRGYTSVAISLPRSAVSQLGDGQISMSIGKAASLVPALAAQGGTNMTKAEIDLFTGPLRQTAMQSVAGDTASVETVRALGHVINALPEEDDLLETDREKLWQNVVGDIQKKMSPEGLARTTRSFNICKGDFNKYGINGMRGCLAHEHDGAMTHVTRKVWEDQKGGS